MIKAIVFDCFDVLYIDAHKTLVERFPDQRAILGDLRRQVDHGFLTRDEYTQTVARLTGITPKEVGDIFLAAHKINQPLLDYITLELKPHYKIGLLSNIGRGWIENLFSQYQLHEFFDGVVLSGDEGITKPHPRIFELIADRLECEPEECFMIDDLPENIAGADAAGMPGAVYGSLRDMTVELQEVLNARAA